MSTAPDCPYCGAKSILVTGETIYPHREDLYHKRFFHCPLDEAWVGVHEMTGDPLGTLANANLRKLRSAAHAAFDPVWDDPAHQKWAKQLGKKDSKPKGYFVPRFRTAAYTALAKAMDISVENCHIGVFNEDQCRKVIKLCKAGEIVLPR